MAQLRSRLAFRGLRDASSVSSDSPFALCCQVAEAAPEAEKKENGVDAYRKMQVNMTRYGCAQLFIEIVGSSASNALKVEAMRLGMALMTGGNRTVQEMVYEYFLAEGEEVFFQDIKERFQKGIDLAKTKKREEKLSKQRAAMGGSKMSVAEPEAEAAQAKMSIAEVADEEGGDDE